MRIVEHDGKDEMANQSIPSSKYMINTPDKHAHGGEISDQEPNNLPMILQHPVYNRHREEETTGLDRKGDPNGRDKIQRQLLMSWTSNPRKSGHLQISLRNTYAQAIHNLIHLCDPTQGVAKTWTAQAKNEATCWAKLTNTWWEPNARPPIEEATPNMEITIQRYYSDHYC